MGKVVPLSAARKRGAYRASASTTANQDAGAQRTENVCRRVVRATKNIALALLRALWIGSVDVLLSVLLALARPARVVLKFGIMALVVILLLEGTNHWRDMRLSMISGGAIVGMLLLLGFYDSLIKWLTIRRNNR